MKKSLNILALATSALILQACGGGNMLGTSDAEDYKLIPEVVTEDPNKPRPSESAPVMKTDGVYIKNASGDYVGFHGINLQFGDDPVGRIGGIKAISETGANLVRLQLRADTNPANLEAALNKIVENNLYAIISLWEPEIECNDDDALFTNALKQVWLDDWLAVIAQDRYQANIMINIASGWGPKSIFDGYSVGYKTYIDNYKTAIRQFRKAGFNVPLVIDAPGCGEDYHAFESARAKELLAADEKKNLILSVHAYGTAWNTGDKIVAGMNEMQKQNIPVIMSEFGGSGLGADKPVNESVILVKAAGDYAATLTVPWGATDDKLAMNVPFEEPVNIANTEVSFDIMLDQSYITDGTMGLQLYLRDINDNYANLAWEGTGNFEAGKWNTRKYTVKDASSFGWSSEGFDLSQVAKIGIELVANGKPVEVTGEVKVDNFKVIEGAVAEAAITYSEDFEGTTGNWVGTQWQGNPVGITEADGSLLLTPQNAGLEAGIYTNGVDYSQPITINARIFFPAKLGSDFYMAFYALGGSWATSNYIGAWAITPGAWNDVQFTADFSAAGNSGIAIQLGGYPYTDAWDVADAMKIDHIEIVGAAPATNTAFEIGEQYHSNFSSDTDGFKYLSWGPAVDVVADNGMLSMTPQASDTTRMVIEKGNLATIDNFNLSDPFTIKTRIKIPASLAGKTFSFQIFLQDANWSNHFNAKVWTEEDLVPGEWTDINLDVEFPEAFKRDALPKYLGFELSSDDGLPVEAFLMDEFIIQGLVPIEKEEIVVALVDFYYYNHFTDFKVDYTAGSLVAESLTDIVGIYQRSQPFNWAAWSWYGNDAEHADWDMTMDVNDATTLTPRGETIVNGKGGIKEYLPEPTE